MQLQGRNLEEGYTGADVSLLHFELNLIGYPLPEDEVWNNTFGPGTQQAVHAFQSKHGLKATGIVDDATAKAINTIVAQQVPIDAVLARLGEEFARYHAQIDQLRQGDPGLAQEVERLRTALQVMQTECERLKGEAAASAAQVAALEQALTAAQERIAELEKLVEKPDGDKTDGFVVHGHVRDPEGKGVSGLIVRAYDQDLPSLQRDTPLGQFLGETATDGDGAYRIAYSAEKFSRAEKMNADLVVCAFTIFGAVIAESALWFNAPSVGQVDLVIASDNAGLSEYEHYLAAIAPLIETVAVADLTAADLGFLAGETVVAKPHLELLVLAHQHAAPPEFEMEAAVFYGLMRGGLPTELNALLAQPPQMQRDALKRAIDENIIPAHLGDNIDMLVEQLQNLRIETMLQPPGRQEPSNLSVMLSTALPDIERQQAFLSLYTQHQDDIEKFWEDLPKQPGFEDAGVVKQIQYTLQLNLLAGGNVPLVQALASDNNLHSTLDLAALDAAAWQARIAATGPQRIAQIPAHIRGTTDEEKIANYAGSIVETLKAAFSSHYLKNAIAAEPAIDLDLVKQVRDLNPDWDFDLRQPLPDDLKWDGIGDGDKQKAQDALTALRAELNTYPGLKAETVLNGEQGFHNPIRTGVQSFLRQAEDFDFGNTNIDVYVAQKGDAVFMDTPDQRDHVTQQLKAFQRIYQVVPRHDSVMALMSAGLHSALAISHVPEEVFVESLGDKVGGRFQARLIHENARELHARATLALGSAIQMTSEIFPRSIMAPGTTQQSTTPAPVSRGDGMAKTDDVRGLYATLFGQLNLCACEHCRSVYSPAAYFVDLLHFLDRDNIPPSTRPPKPLNVLLGRRPDIQHIALTCENTNTLIPYVDLVNEILESYIVYNNLNRSLGNAGSATSAELLATPQNVSRDAYDRLKAAVYPMTLPFDRNLEIVRTYLAHLGTSRHTVMRTFQRQRPLTSDAQTDLAIEYLKISPSERDILTGAIFAAPSPPTLAKLYGYEATDDGLPPVELETVAPFLEWTRLRYEQLTEILRTRFINPNGADHKNSIIIAFSDDRCDTNSRYLRLKKDRERTGEPRSLQAEAWDRLQRFIRLWRKLGWSIADVDRALSALGATTPDDLDLRFLRRLGQVVQLRDDLGLSLPQTLSLWADIDTYGNDDKAPQVGSLYSDLFLSRTVGDLAAHPQAFALPIPDAVPAGARTISHPQNRLAIQAALRITAVDLDAIQARAGFTDESSLLSLGYLSALHRYALLARALQMRVRDMLDLETLSGIHPFSLPSPTAGNANPTQQEGTARFVALARKVQRSGFSMTLLNYFYRHRQDPTHQLGLRAEESEAHLTMLRDGLRNLLREFDAPESEQERLRKVLSTVVADPAAVERILTLPNGIMTFIVPLAERPSVVFPDPLSAKISYDDVQKQLRFHGAMTEGERTTLTELADSTDPYHPYRDAIRLLFDLPREMIARPLGAFLAADDLLAQLVNNSAATWSSRYQYIVPRALDFLSRSFVIQSLADALRLDVDMMQEIVTNVLRSRADATKPILADFLALSTPITPPSAGAPEPLPMTARQALELLHKSGLLVTTARLTAAELAHLAAHGADFDGFDLNALPLSETAPPASFASWEHLHDLVAFRASLPRGDELVKVFGAADFTAAKEALLTATGWDRAALDSALSDQGLQISATNFHNHFKNEARLLDLATSITFSRQLGVSPATGFTWAANTPDATQAREVQSAAKAKYDEKAWLTIAKSLNDPLRERQRDALVAYTLTLPTLPRGIRTSMDLFEYFLIDVDMSACQPTSRIKQAISSVQLFVQRCLMNLEPSVSPKLLPADQWQWMRNYRVWEANRKVFLYPENWIESALRDDKSPIFKELENDMLMNDLTAETVENAFMSYLEKLDEIARLDVRGMYWEHESELTWNETQADPAERADVLHIFARTQGVPPVYYYRRLINHRQWTPWEKVQADIEGDHLIPVVFNRRLYLFWPLFRETTDMNQPPPQEGQPARQSVRWREISLAWIEYKNGSWSAKKTSKATIRSYQLLGGEWPRYTFAAFVDKNSLFIGLTGQIDVSGMTGFAVTGCDGELTVEHREHFRERAVDSLPLYAVDNQQYTMERGVGFYLWEQGQARFAFPPPRTLEELRQRGLGRIRLTVPRQNFTTILAAPFFYQDREHTYFVTPEQDAGIAAQIEAANTVTLSLPNVRLSLSASGMRASAAPNPGTNSAVAEGPIWQESLVCVGNQIDFYEDSHSPQRPPTRLKLRFHTFFHPYVCDFIKRLKRKGIPGLLALDVHKQSDFTRNGTDPGDNAYTQFKTRYHPTEFVDRSYPKADVDFDGGAYAVYNWELFFHVPLLIADHLSQNQRFEEAQQWFHYILDPTISSTEPSPQRYWNVLPFYRNHLARRDQISEQMFFLGYRGNDAEILRRKEDLEAQIDVWRNDPFNPHHIARLRITAYQKNVLMKYIDNLLAWGDQLFRQDTIESINQATQLYILAYQLLGPRPEIVPPPSQPPVQTFAELRSELDRFSNALVSSENGIAGRRCMRLTPSGDGRNGGSLSLGATLYFCIPPNDKLLSYWDTVEDRLFKIRHCMNIEGVVRQLPLFEPPIDPALLVRARAAGLDLSRILNDINAGLPHYRFHVMLQKALDLCGEVRALGTALLSALEKRDAEALSLLRSTHELRLLEAVGEARRKQVEEAQITVESLHKSRQVTEIRHQFYAERGTLNQSPPLSLNAQETLSLEKYRQANDDQAEVGGWEVAAAIAHVIPNLNIPWGTSFGGTNIGNGLNAIARSWAAAANARTSEGSRASTMGGYDRRADEWRLQEKLADKELEQIDKQIAAAQIRQEIANKELRNHELHLENAQAVDEFMRTKFTNRELYDWMVAQTSALYFQAYQLAYDLAKRAERAYQFERGVETSNFIQFGYWDSLRKGLLAGERLTLDLKRLDAAYLDQNRRDYEITKHISLVLHDPLALIALKTTGACAFRLPEALFDADYPGHFMRRLKSVSVTIPAVVGPYTSINCTLTLQSHKIRKNTSRADGAARYAEQGDDDRFLYNFAPLQSIATSHGQNDTGMFELNFRDERYLPFEGAGAISEWRIEMPKDTNAFDFDTIADVIIRLNYTARDGGEQVRNAARSALRLPTAVVPRPAEPPVLRRMFSLKHEFGVEWARFLQAANPQTIEFNLSPERLPFLLRGSRTILVQQIDLFWLMKESAATTPSSVIVRTPAGEELRRAGDGSSSSDPVAWPLQLDATFGGVPHAVVQPVNQETGALRDGRRSYTWSLTPLSNGARLDASQFEDVIVVCTLAAG